MVPYHNLTHAFSITQFLFAVFYSSSEIKKALTPVDVLAIFAAAPCHDIDHPGNNNAWEVATQSELAIRYKDTSVLENHHAAIGLEIMSDMLTNLFGTLSPEQTQEVRETFVHAILQTDMALHFKMVDQLKEVQALKKDVPFSKESLTERRYLLGMLLHSVDISNPLLPDFELSRKWAERINEEFLNQYRNELRLGYPVTKMWSALDTNKGFFDMQVGFINFIVTPLWSVITDIYEQLESKSHLMKNLADNKYTWQKLADSDEAESMRSQNSQASSIA
jgi:high affinity cGMP-specific 3',5'-cyclic phosphodiesterase 9